jgi:HK97 gp10 family phage protein
VISATSQFVPGPAFQGALEEAIRLHAEQAVQSVSERVLAAAQAIVPVDTGALRDSGYLNAVEGGDPSMDVGFSKDYAPFLEFGTHKMQAQPYLRPALDEEKAALLPAVVASTQEAVNGFA